MKKIIGIAAAIMVVLSSISYTFTSYANINDAREYHLKAAFLRYVAKFVTWPENAIPETAINICVLGEIPAFSGLNSINGKLVNDRSIVIRTIPRLDVAKGNCQILYLAKDQYPNTKAVLDYTDKLPILTFGDDEGFAIEGGGMNFYVVNNRMAIMINQETVANSNLKIHPRMLRLVTITPDIGDD